MNVLIYQIAVNRELFLALAAVAIVLLTFCLLADSAIMARLLWHAERIDLVTRYRTELQILRAPGMSFDQRLTSRLFRDGQIDQPMLTSTNTFLFLKVSLAVIFEVLGIVMWLVSGNQVFVLFGLIGYATPSGIAALHHRTRRGRIADDTQDVLDRLRNEIGHTADIREAVRRVASTPERANRPLFRDLAWAARAMENGDQWEAIRRLDERLDTSIWSDIADNGQAAAERSPKDMQDTLATYITDLIQREFTEPTLEKVEKVDSKIMSATTAPLLIGIMLAALSVILIPLLSGSLIPQ